MDVNMLLGMTGLSQPQSRMGGIGSAKNGQGDFFAGLLQQVSQDGNEEYAEEIGVSPPQLMSMMQLGRAAKTSDSKVPFTDLLMQVSQDGDGEYVEEIRVSPLQLMSMMQLGGAAKTSDSKVPFTDLLMQVSQDGDGKSEQPLMFSPVQLMAMMGTGNVSAQQLLTQLVEQNISEQDAADIQEQMLQLMQIGIQSQQADKASNADFALEQLLAILKAGMLDVSKAEKGANLLPVLGSKYDWLTDLQVSPQLEAKEIMDDFQKSDAYVQVMAMLLLPQYQQNSQQNDIDPAQVANLVNDLKTKELAQGFVGEVFGKIAEQLQQQDLSQGKIDISSFQQIVEKATEMVGGENPGYDMTKSIGAELAKKIVLFIDHEVNKFDKNLDAQIPQSQVVNLTAQDTFKLASEQNHDFFGGGSEKQLKKDEELTDKINTSSEFTSMIADNTTVTRPTVAEVEQTKTANLPPKEEIIRQIVDKASLHKDKASSEMHIQLNPEHLGKVIMKIRVEAGTVSAQFLIENQQTKDVVQANITQLKQALSDQGIKVNEVNVALGGHNFMQHHSDGRKQGRWGEQKNKNLKGIAAKEAINEIEKSQLVIPGITGNRKFIYRDTPRMSFDSMA